MNFPDVGTARMALMGAVLSCVTIALLPPFWLIVRRIFPGRNVFFARWGFLDVARVIFIGVIAAFLANLLFGGIESNLIRNLTATVFVFGCMSALCARIATQTEPSGARALGFEAGKTGRAIGAGLFLYIAMLPGIIGLSFIAPWAVEIGGGAWEVQAMLPEFLALDSGTRILAALLMVIVVPLFEEVLFRGFLQPLLVQNLREPGGIALTSLIFAALHDSDMFLPVFGLSLVLGTVKLRTQRLAASWCVHAAHNAIVLLLFTYSPEVRSALGS